MNRARAAVRLAALGVMTAVTYLVYMSGRGLLLPWEEKARRWRHSCFRTWSRGICRILGVVVEVRGEPPPAPFFLVSNHLSYLDIPVLAAQLDAVFVAKAEVGDWPGVGALCRSVDTLFVDRRSRKDVVRVNEEIQRLLDSGSGVILFAEGTSTPGKEVAPFRSPLLDYPAQNRYPVQVAAVSYRTPAGQLPAHLGVCWWGDMEFSGHLVELAGLKEIDATLCFGRQPVEESERKALARKLHAAVSDLFVPVVREEECLMPTP